MHKLYDLKEHLMKELEAYGGSDSMDVGSLEVIDKLAHATKNVIKIIESCGDEGKASYEGESYNDRSYRMGRSYRDGSYRRGRDSMGRYSRASETAEGLRELMNTAPDEHTRNEIQRIIDKLG